MPLLLILIGAAYAPVFFAGFSPIDDSTVVDRHVHTTEFNIRLLASSGNLYYRPLTELTFIFDKLLFNMNPRWMHLENVLLHGLNAVLIYFLTRSCLSPREREASFAPLIAALLFGLHPICTENVSWISGRYDVLALFFVLLSALMVIRFAASGGEAIYLAAAVFLIFFAALAKETALGFLPGFFIIASVHGNGATAASRRIKTLFLVFMAIVVVFCFSFLPRMDAFLSHKTPMGKTIVVLSADWVHDMFVMLGAFGFYLKKIFIPFPLNFSIISIDSLYELLAVPLVMFCMYVFASRWTFISAMFLSGVFLIAPAFVLAFSQIAWTAYAERYIYMGSAFIMISAVLFFHDRFSERYINPITISVLIVILIMFAATIDRANLWTNDFAFAKDAVEKSPDSKSMRYLYAKLLFDKGRYDEAISELEKGKALPALNYEERFDLGIGWVFEKKGEWDKALDRYQNAFHRSGEQSAKALSCIIDLLEKRRKSSASPREQRDLALRLFQYNLTLFKLNYDTHALYRLGMLSADLGNDAKAIRFFQQAYRLMGEGDTLRKQAAENIAALRAHEKITSDK